VVGTVVGVLGRAEPEPEPEPPLAELEPGALAVKNAAEPEPLAFGDPVDPVQAEVASAANTVTVLHNTAASLAGIRMKPPDYPGISGR
jgi:hypothetical protein